MVNPQIFGVNPQVAAAAKQVGEYVEAHFVKERGQHRFTVTFMPQKPLEELQRVNLDLGQVVDQMVEVMATQLYNFFGIGGKIRDE